MLPSITPQRSSVRSQQLGNALGFIAQTGVVSRQGLFEPELRLEQRPAEKADMAALIKQTVIDVFWQDKFRDHCIGHERIVFGMDDLRGHANVFQLVDPEQRW